MAIYYGLNDLPRQTNYETARALAQERLKAMDLKERCEKAGVPLTSRYAEVRLIDRLYFLDRDSFEITAAAEKAPPELWEEIIILHYLATATGAPLSGELISFQQIPEAATYYPSFLKRTSGILLPRFGEKPEDLEKKAKELGGDIFPGLGDLAVSVSGLPRVQYVIVWWKGDHEFPPEIRVLFDRHITQYLPTEDITVLGQMICLKLVR